MENIEDILNTLPKRVAMTAEEKSRQKAAISAYMDAHPIAEAPIASPYSKIPSIRSLQFARVHAFQALALILLVTCGAVSAAAQGALPGDPLYAVKINVNEGVGSLFAVTPQSRAEHEASLAAVRLNEAADLSAQGRLTPQVQSQIEASVETHIKNVEKNTDTLASSNNVAGAVEVNSDLQSTLHANEQVLRDLSGSSEQADAVAATIRQQLSTVSGRLNAFEKQMSDETGSNSEEQARQKSLDAEAALAAAKAGLAATDQSTSTSFERASNRLSSAVRYLSDGYTSIKNASYNQAFIDFQTSIRYSNETQVFLAAPKNQAPSVVGDMGDEDATATPPLSGTDAENASTTTLETDIRGALGNLLGTGTEATTTASSGIASPGSEQSGTSTFETATGTASTSRAAAPKKGGIIKNLFKLGL